jgi:hypothetical protein
VPDKPTVNEHVGFSGEGACENGAKCEGICDRMMSLGFLKSSFEGGFSQELALRKHAQADGSNL